jgi:hypothetical protein
MHSTVLYAFPSQPAIHTGARDTLPLGLPPSRENGAENEPEEAHHAERPADEKKGGLVYATLKPRKLL